MTGWQMPSSQQVPKILSMGSRGLSCPPRGALASPRDRASCSCPRVPGALWREKGERRAWDVSEHAGSAGPAVPARRFPSCGRARWSRWHSGVRQRLRSSARGPRWEATARRWYHQLSPGPPARRSRCQRDCTRGVTAAPGTGWGAPRIEREPPVRQLLALARLPQCSTKRVRMPPAAPGGDAGSVPCS